MDVGRQYPESRIRVERRVRPDRRNGLDRRIVDRRLQTIPVQVERRRMIERRSLVERRSPASRRSWIDRRASRTGAGPAVGS